MKPALTTVPQMNTPWHADGMFVGMHWIWWIIWICTIGVLLWALWRALADRADTHNRVARQEAAEEELRRRFAVGEIDEDEFVQRMRILSDTVQRSLGEE